MSKQIKKYKPNHIIISSFARAKNINTNNIKTTLYLHSPMQYIWTHYDEYSDKIKGRKWRIFRQITPILRKRDSKSRSYNKVVSNSQYTQQQGEKIYNISSTIQYPPIDRTVLQIQVNPEYQNYFIYSGRLVTFVKEVDKIIQACNQTKTQLIVMGDGPDKEKLQTTSGETIIYIPRIQDIHKRIQLIQWAKWLINITKESFGISTMEALLLGVPVLWYNDGASPELIDKHSGILISDKKITTICTALQQRDNKEFDRKKIQKQARHVYEKYSNIW
jgi:glycosyltransferase involved in cell wall biosynthesis